MSQRAGGAERLVLPVPAQLEVVRQRVGLREVDLDQLAEVADAEVDRRGRPQACSRRRMCSRIGRSPTGTSGFGRIVVYGRSRVPSPPARITALIGATLHLAEELGDARVLLRDDGERGLGRHRSADARQLVGRDAPDRDRSRAQRGGLGRAP